MANTPTKLPALPDLSGDASLSQQLRSWVAGVTMWLNVRESRLPNADPLDRVLTVRDIGSENISKIQSGTIGSGAQGPSGPMGPTGPAGEGIVVDLTPPPSLTGVSVVATITSVIISYDQPSYVKSGTSESNHARTEVWLADAAGDGSSPGFGAAKKMGESSGPVIYIPLGATGRKVYVWLQNVSRADVVGPRSGGVEGYLANTGKVGNADLTNLIIDAAKIADGAVDIGGSKVTGTITDPARFGAAVIGSAAIQNLAVTNAKMADLAVDDAKIANLHAAKLVAGTVTADKFITNLFQSDNVLTRNLTVRDASGNIILGAGYSLNWSNIAGQPAGIYNSNIYLNNGSIQGIGAGAGTVIDNAFASGASPNLAKNPKFAGAVSGATSCDGWSAGGSGSINYNMFYNDAVAYVPWAPSQMVYYANVNAGGDVGIDSDYITVSETGVFCLSVWARRYSGSSPNAYLGLWCYNRTGTNLGLVYPSGLAAFNTSSSWAQYKGYVGAGQSVQLPSGTSKVRIHCGIAAGVAGGVFFSDPSLAFGLAPASDGLYLTSSNASTFIANAAIGTAHIQNAAITNALIANAAVGLANINTATIGTLSALSADMGSITAGSLALIGSANFSVKTSASGARQEMTSRAIKIFDAAGTLRVRIGDLSA